MLCVIPGPLRQLSRKSATPVSRSAFDYMERSLLLVHTDCTLDTVHNATAGAAMLVLIFGTTELVRDFLRSRFGLICLSATLRKLATIGQLRKLGCVCYSWKKHIPGYFVTGISSTLLEFLLGALARFRSNRLLHLCKSVNWLSYLLPSKGPAYCH